MCSQPNSNTYTLYDDHPSGVVVRCARNQIARYPFHCVEDHYTQRLCVGEVPTLADFAAFLQYRFGPRHDATDALDRVTHTRWSGSSVPADLERHIRVFQDARLVCDKTFLPEVTLTDRFLVSLPTDYRLELWRRSFSSAEQAYEAARQYQRMCSRFSVAPSSSRPAATSQSRGTTRGRSSFAGRFRRLARPGASFSRRYNSLEYGEDASAELDPTVGDTPEDIEFRDVIQYLLDDDTVPVAERLQMAMSAMGRACSRDTTDTVLSAPSSVEVPSASQQTATSSTSPPRLPTRRAIRTARCSAQLVTRDDVVSSLLDLSILQARQERLTRHVNVLRRLLALLSDPDRTLPIIPIRLGTSTRVYRALWDSGLQGDFVHPRVVEEARLATSGSRSPISVTLGDNKTQRFFDRTVPDLHFSLTLQPSDSTQTPRRYHSSSYFDVLETGYNFILGTPRSRRFRGTKAEWATETLVLKTKYGQIHRVPFIGTTGDTPPDLPPQDPRPSGSHPDIAFTSPRQFAHFIQQEDVTFYSVNVMDLLRYDLLCPEVELISLEPDPPDPPSIFAAPISTSTRQPADTPFTSQASAPSTVESTHTSCADADAEELTQFTADLESVVRDLIREYRDVFPPYFSYNVIPPMRSVEHSIQLVSDYRVHHQAPYRLSIPEATELKRQLEELLRLFSLNPVTPLGVHLSSLLAKRTELSASASTTAALTVTRFTTQSIKGEMNRVADALSRRPDHNHEPIHLAAISITTVDQSVIDAYRTQYHHCPDYRVIHATLQSSKTVPSYSLRENGLVYWHGRSGKLEPRICIPSTGQLRVQAVAEFHDQAAVGHMGFHKTLARVCRLYVWPKSKDFVKAYIQECPTCQEVNSANHLSYGLLQPLSIPEGRWQSISIDFIGPLRPPTERGHDAILVVVNRFTKHARFVPCRYRINAREVVDIVFDQVVRDHGLPQTIISDRDPRFTSTFWRRLHKVYGSQLRFSSSYHPQTDGQTEVTNKILGNILRKFVRDDQQ
ncbi:hypothetical protein CBR_g54821 [Chara braunii]|uniref:Integrase catalytic domain-containing protein n=1 Tax=Chara braunii TaxID=69332 RepID=A0A388JPG9_CHABU|nr:hypothetical protein CBR_g54821 [Chara braunii]|eukprot:GBG59716.1 hypothetical protein CBR_g54821 [Chara braunii]